MYSKGFSAGDRRRAGSDGGSVSLATLMKRENSIEKMIKPDILHGFAHFSKKGEDFSFIKTDCQRVQGNCVSEFSAFGIFMVPSVLQIFDGHNGSAAAKYAKENLLNNILRAIPSNLDRDKWLAVLPRALVSGFVKTDKDFQDIAQTSGTTATFVIIDGWVITVASVGDSRCILESEGSLYILSADHRLDVNVEEVERITASGGEVGRLHVAGGAEHQVLHQQLENLRGQGYILQDQNNCLQRAKSQLERSHACKPLCTKAPELSLKCAYT